MHQTPSHVECSLNGLDLGGIGLAGADRLTGLTAPHELPVARASIMPDSSKADPTFATIEAFKAAGNAFDAAYDMQESALARERAAAQVALDAASDALKDTRESLFNVPPTSFVGLGGAARACTTEPDIAEWLIHAGDAVDAMRFFHTHMQKTRFFPVFSTVCSCVLLPAWL